MSTWERRLRAVRVRLSLRAAVEEAPRLALATTGLWALTTLLFRTIAGVEPPWPWPTGLGASLLAAILLLPWRLRRTFRLEQAAVASDRFLQSRDLLATALWLQRQQTVPAAGQVVLRRAETAASTLDPSRVVRGPEPLPVVRRVILLATVALLGVLASLAPLPVLRPGGPGPSQEARLPASLPRPPEADRRHEQEPDPPLQESLKQLEEQLAEGEATPQAARETLDRLLRGLEAADPGSAPRSALTPAEQSELESLLEQVIGRSGDPTSGGPVEPDAGREGSQETEGDRPGEGGSSPQGPGEPTFDPGQEPGSPGTGPDQQGPPGGAEVPGGPQNDAAPAPAPGEAGGQEPSGEGEGTEGELPGPGARPGTEPGDPFEGPGSLPPPAASSGEQDVLPSNPEPGPYGLGEGAPVSPAAPQEAAGLPDGGGTPAPGTDPGEEPVTSPLLPALYREWLQRYFTPAAP